MNTKGITSITLILTGSILTAINTIGTSWASALASIVGFIFLFVGLTRFKSLLDEKGQDAVKLLVIAAITGTGGMLLDLIPGLNVLSSIVYLAVFIIELFGFLRLKESNLCRQSTGSQGINLILISMVIMILAVLFNLIPFVGQALTSLVALFSLILLISGWIKIQEAVIEQVKE